MTRDPRLTFARPEIAHIALRGKVPARRFAAGALHRVTRPTAALFGDVLDDRQQRAVLYGHPVRTLPFGDEVRVFAQDEATGYVGFVDRTCLGGWVAPTHWVSARSTLVYATPDFKTRPKMALSIGAHVAVQAQEGRFSRTTDGHYVITDHLAHIDRPETDPIKTAIACLGAPYLWGGNDSAGLDCSGLVSLSFATCGKVVPGDSDLQEAALGPALPPDTPFERGDLLFWKGHVAMVVDQEVLIHANAHHMAVTFEPIKAAVSRIAAQGDGPVTSHIRPAL